MVGCIKIGSLKGNAALRYQTFAGDFSFLVSGSFYLCNLRNLWISSFEGARLSTDYADDTDYTEARLNEATNQEPQTRN
jgi:hypothetical protein